jgi:hypothetical protein
MAREWARSLKNLAGNESAQCDVVNGGFDQLAYLLLLPSTRRRQLSLSKSTANACTHFGKEKLSSATVSARPRLST